MILSITAPTVNDRGPRCMQDVFAALHQSQQRGEVLELLYGSYQGRVGIFCRAADSRRERLTKLIHARYPDCQVETLPDNALDPPDGVQTLSGELCLTPSLFPILRFQQFEDLLERKLDDAIELLLAVIRPDENGVRPLIEIAVTPATGRQQRFARSAVKVLDRPFFREHFWLAGVYARCITRPRLWLLAWPLRLLAPRRADRYESKTDTTAARQGDRTDDVQAASDKIGGHLFQVRARLTVSAPAGAELEAREKLRTMYAAFGAFTVSRLALFKMRRLKRGVRRRLRPERGGRFFLSHYELATLFHPPTANVQAEQLARTPFRELPPPVNLPAEKEEGAVTLGHVRFRSDARRFGISRIDRRQHLYIVGRTGVGKTSLLESLVRSDIENSRGVCVIDPHGGLAERIIASIPRQRTNEVVVFDPSDEAFAVSYNPLACPDPQRRDLVADGVLSAFDKIYDFSHTPRLSDTMRSALYVLIEKEQTLLDLLRFFSNPSFHERMLLNIEDDLAREFWRREFPSWNKQDRNLTAAAIQNKVRPFLMNLHVRAIMSQPGKSLNLRELMDEGKVVVVNLSKGKLGEGNSRLLGALLVAGLKQAAMSRADVPEDERRDFYLYVDEFQSFSTGSFADILSEARKYRLNMTVAHQHISQLDEEIADAVFGNVGSMVAFQVGSDDADMLSRQLRKHRDQLLPEDFTNLPKYHAYVRLLQNGMPEHPFSMRTIEPLPIAEDRTEIVRRASNERYAARKEDVLAGIKQQFAGLCAPQQSAIKAPRWAASMPMMAGATTVS